jgi:hypothetical protein
LKGKKRVESIVVKTRKESIIETKKTGKENSELS